MANVGRKSRRVGTLSILGEILFWMLEVGMFNFLGFGRVQPISIGLPTTNSHNARAAKLDFYIPHAGVLQCGIFYFG